MNSQPALVCATSESPRTVDSEAWNLIDRGIRTQTEIPVRDGNLSLLRREQLFIVQPIYAAIETIRATVFVVRVEVPLSFTTVMSFMSRNPIPGGPSFWLACPGKNLGVFNDRWSWIDREDDLGMFQIRTGESPIGLTAERTADWVEVPLSRRAREAYAVFPDDVP